MAIDTNSWGAQTETLPWEPVKLALLGSAATWVPKIFPRGKRGENGDWRLADVTGREPRRKGSMVIQLFPKKADEFSYDFDPTVQRSYDPISLVKEHFRLEGRALFDRCVEIVDRFAGRVIAPAAHEASARPTPTHEDEVEKAEATAREVRFRLEHAYQELRGTAAEAYYAARGLDIPITPHLRFHPSCPPYPGASQGHPTIMGMVYTPDRQWTGGIHQTYLKPDGSWHIGGDKSKMMMGPCRGGFLHFAPPDPASGLLLLGEGPESTLAAAKLYLAAHPEIDPATLGVWSALNAGGMGTRPKDRPMGGLAGWLLANRQQTLIKRLVICVDKDEAGRSAGTILVEACQRIRLPVELYQPAGPEGSDFDDDLLDGLPLGEAVPINDPTQPELTLEPIPTEPVAGKLPDSLLPKPMSEDWKPTGFRKPELQLDSGNMVPTIKMAEHHLINEGPGLYQYGDVIVRSSRKAVHVRDNTELAFINSLVQLKTNDLLYHLNDVIRFTKYNGKTKDYMGVDCPEWVARTYLERRGEWKLPPLMGVCSHPLLRPDFSILDEPGYDPVTRILFDPLGVAFPEIPRNPTRAQCEAAAALFRDLVSTFPFDGEASRSVAIAAMISAIARRTLPTVPMFGFNAPVASSGKSKLMDMCAVLADGHVAAPINISRDEAEFEKALGSALIQGNSVIAIDNATVPIDSARLCSMLTQTMVSIRILGASVMPSLPNTALILLTGNNLVVVGDLTRRSLVATIDPQHPRPELRDFSHVEDAVMKAGRLRPELVVAAITIMLGYHQVGSPNCPVALGSFEEWSKRVRAAMIWVGFADPVSSIEVIRAADPVLESIATLMYAWARVFPPGTATNTQELIDVATRMQIDGGVLAERRYVYSDLREALVNVAGAGNGGTLINNKRLSRWLTSHKNRILQLDSEHGKLQFRQTGLRAGTAVWTLEKVD